MSWPNYFDNDFTAFSPLTKVDLGLENAQGKFSMRQIAGLSQFILGFRHKYEKCIQDTRQKNYAEDRDELVRLVSTLQEFTSARIRFLMCEAILVTQWYDGKQFAENLMAQAVPSNVSFDDLELEFNDLTSSTSSESKEMIDMVLPLVLMRMREKLADKIEADPETLNGLPGSWLIKVYKDESDSE